MKALFYLGPGELELRDIEIEKKGVVIKVLKAGICGTDVKTFLRGHHMFKPPTILGHECFGIVEEKPECLKNIDVGDLVVLAPYAECGVCDECINGVPELCMRKTFMKTGCFSQYVNVPVVHAIRGLFRIEEDDDRYVLCEPLACVMGALRKVERKDKVLVVGGGIMGALFAMKLGSSKVKVVEISEWRTEFLKDLGFDVVQPDEIEGEFDLVVIAATIEDPFRYMEHVLNGGTVLLFGGYPRGKTLELDPYHVHYREVRILGSFGYSIADFAKALKEIEQNREYSKLITHVYYLEDYEKAFKKAVNRDCMKVVLRMWKDEEKQTP